jgi:aspartate kinase
VKVLKFGGASLRDGTAIRKAAAIVRDSGPCVVVTSAMEGTTDGLARVQASAARDQAAIKPFLRELQDRHAAALAVAAPGDAAAPAEVAALTERLERLLYGIAYTQEVTPRLHDLVQSYGERMAAPVLAAAVRAQGAAAAAMDAEAARLRTHGPFGNARPDLVALRSECAPAVKAVLRRETTPVVTGYYGVDAEGRATLFGRGGSDYVASLVAYALQAERLELWKDVAGFLTADPRAVPAARLIPSLGYDEAAELANFGAKVLHPRTVEPAEAAGIPIHIRCVQEPAAAGTVVEGNASATPAFVRSVATTSGLAILRLNGPGMSYSPGVAKRVFDRLAEAGVNVINMATSQASFALLLDEQDLARGRQALEPLQGGTVQSFDGRGGRSLVCVVGKGLGETPGSAARILQSVADAKVNVEMISLGASDIAIDFIVQSKDAARAVRAIHDRFLEVAS